MCEMNSSKNILIIEDEVPISELISYAFKKEGFKCSIANDGNTGIELLKKYEFDLIILDLMLPDISGFDVCRQTTKEYNIPIVMLTAKSDLMDKICGLELGADDYLTKPFDIRELITRVKTIFRRIELVSKSIDSKEDRIIKVSSGIEIYIEEHKVCKDKEFVELTPKEYSLLLLMAQNKNRVFSRTELLDKVWGFDYLGDSRTVDIHVQRLRKKLDSDKSVSIIETVFGVGYKLLR